MMLAHDSTSSLDYWEAVSALVTEAGASLDMFGGASGLQRYQLDWIGQMIANVGTRQVCKICEQPLDVV